MSYTHDTTMKRISLLLCMLALTGACTKLDESNIDKTPVDPNIGIVPEKGDPEAIDTRIFTCINLDYPGLEEVKEHYSAKDYWKAANALLDYYRSRVSVTNPNVNLTAPQITEAGQNIADQALEGRFYVRNYKEKRENGKDIYWSFKSKDGKIDWMFEPGNADKEFGIQKHRHQWVIYQAQAFAVTRDEKYVKSWIETYKDWAKTFPYKEGKVNYDESMSGSVNLEERNYGRAWSGLQPAERLLSQLDALLYFLPSASFTPEWLSEFLVMMAQTAENIKANPVKEENSNIRLAQDQALATVGILMPEFNNAGQWLEHGSKEIGRHLDNQFNADGVQNELDPSYHMGVIGDFLKVYGIADQNNCLDRFPADYKDKLKNASRFLMDVIWPNYTVDNFNDTRSARMSKNVLLRNLKQYSSLFPDDMELKWMATEGRSEEPQSTLRKYEVSGWYMLRSGWKPGDMMLIHKNNFNPYDRWHCQNDNGTVSIYNDGRCFTPDAGVYSYGGSSSSNADRRAFAATSMHNTLTKNKLDISKGHAKGRFLKSGQSGNAEFIVTENASYDDMSHRRAIFMVEKKFYVIVDEAFGTAKDVPAVLNFSLCRDLEKGGLAENVAVADDLSDHYIYGMHTIFGDGNNMLFRTFTDSRDNFKANEGTCYYSDDIGVKARRKRYQVSVDKKADQEVRFITVILPFRNPEDLEKLEISATFRNAASNAPTGAAVTVTIGDKVYDLEYSL